MLAPFLVEEISGDTVRRRVVLSRPGNQELQAALRNVDCPHIVAEQQVVQTATGAWAVSAFVPGIDLVSLREHHPEGVPSDVVVAVLQQVLVALSKSAAVGVFHGDLAPSTIRLADEGVVRVVGFRGGEAGSDVAALQDVVLSLVEASDGSLPAGGLAELAHAWPQTLSALADRLADLPTASLRELGRRASVPDTWHNHTLSGSEIAVQGTLTAPPKVRIAAIGIVVLLLGIGGGLVMAGVQFGGTPSVSVPGAKEVRLDCEPLVYGGPTLSLAGPVTCRVQAVLANDASIDGILDGRLSEQYLCEPDDGELKCTEL